MHDAEPPSPHAAASAPPEARRSTWRRALTIVAALALAAVLVPVVARLFGWEAGPLAFVVALMPWVTLAGVVPILLALAARSWVLLAASVAVTVLGVGWAVPMFSSQQALGGEALTVATINLTFGGADANAVVRLVERNQVDVLAAQEVTPESAEALSLAGLDDLLPYSQVAAEPGITGTALWSSTPLTDAESLDGFAGAKSIDGYASRAVRGDIKASGKSLTVLAVHPNAPGPITHAGWDASMMHLTELLKAQSEPMLVLGDFNTTRDHQVFRDIESLGFIDAADQAGAGFVPTFPEGRSAWPFVAIDHVLVGNIDLVATSVSTATVPGADHRMLLVTYSIS